MFSVIILLFLFCRPLRKKCLIPVKFKKIPEVKYSCCFRVSVIIFRINAEVLRVTWEAFIMWGWSFPLSPTTNEGFFPHLRWVRGGRSVRRQIIIVIINLNGKLHPGHALSTWQFLMWNEWFFWAILCQHDITWDDFSCWVNDEEEMILLKVKNGSLQNLSIN